MSVTVVVDLLKGMLAIHISQLITGDIWVAAITAMPAAIGHCWSVYIRFYGGLGATITIGMLFYTGIAFTSSHIPREFILGGLVALGVLVASRNSTLATVVLVLTISAVLFAELLRFDNGTVAMAVLPPALLGVQFAKRRTSNCSEESRRITSLQQWRNIHHG